MKLSRMQAICGLFLAAVLCVPASASTTDTNSALPGTLNYVEGNAQFEGTPLNAKSVGQNALEIGQTLSTQEGKAELLLTPGVYLRLGNNSSVKMVDNSLTDTALQVMSGHVMVDVTDLYKQNDIRIQEGNANARLLKNGLYDFDLKDNHIRVFSGKTVVDEGDRHVTIKGNHEITLAENAPRKAKPFEKKEFESGDLYRWNTLRSTYIAEANAPANGWYGPNWWGYDWWGPGWWGPGWFGPGWGWGWGWGGWWGPWW
jgi:hypothetical protein